MKKKFLALLLAALMVVSLLPTVAFATDLPSGATDWVVDSGDNHVWYKLEKITDAPTYKLTIGGTGDMPVFGSGSEQPWGTNRTVITTVVINSGVTSISQYAFQTFAKLESVTIPSSVKAIGSKAFMGCSNFAELHIESIKDWCGIKFSSNDSNPFNANGASNRKLLVDGNETTDLVIPDGVSAIPKFAFYGWKMLTSVTIPSSVTDIGEQAFYNCGKLTSVNVKATKLPTLGTKAFTNCSMLNSIYVPYGKGTTYKSATNWSSYESKIKEAYMVDVAAATNGTVTVDKDFVPTDAESKTVTVTATPNEGYQLKSLSYYTTDPATTTSITGNSFEPTANVTVTAEFIQTEIPATKLIPANINYETLAKGAAIAAGITVVAVGTIHTVKAIKNYKAEKAAAAEAAKLAEMPMVRMGDSCDAVTTLQTKLNELGYNCGEVDGVFGQNTLNAVIAFQTAKGLTADGIVGELTWAALL